MIDVKDLIFWYSKKKKIFEGLDLQLGNGHIFGLLGKNGAGKTTLLNLICGLSFPKSGSVRVDGNDPAKRALDFLSEIFLLPEQISVPALTVQKFALINGPFYPAFDQDQFREHLDKLEIKTDQNLSGMSLGQKKKAMIAFALATHTRYLFLDEPTNGLDIPSKAAFRSILASAFTEESTIILSTHMVRDLESLIDSVIMLDDRMIILNAPLDHVARKLTFSRSSLPMTSNEIIYSASGELGPVNISLNHAGLQGNVDLEALFNACIHESEKISACLVK